MRYKYAKTNRNGIDYTLVELMHAVDEPKTPEADKLSKLYEKYDPIKKNVIIVTKKANGSNDFVGTNMDKVDFPFGLTEDFSNLLWSELEIDDD